VLRFGILGPIEVVADDGPLRLGGRRQRSALALLLLNTNRVVSIDELADALYAGRPPVTAVTQVHKQVAELRSVLGPEAIRTQGSGYVINPARTQLDLARFEGLLADATEAMSRSDAPAPPRSSRMRSPAGEAKPSPTCETRNSSWRRPAGWTSCDSPRNSGWLKQNSGSGAMPRLPPSWSVSLRRTRCTSRCVRCKWSPSIVRAVKRRRWRSSGVREPSRSVGSNIRTAVFTSTDPVDDATRFVDSYAVDLVLVDSVDEVDGEHVPDELSALFDRSTADVAVVSGAPRISEASSFRSAAVSSTGRRSSSRPGLRRPPAPSSYSWEQAETASADAGTRAGYSPMRPWRPSGSPAS
jgi:hypothetical protein